MRPGTFVALGMGVAATIASARADAQVVASPYVHANFGDVEFRRGGPGLSVGYVGRWIGVEVDVDYHSHFFKDAELDSVPNPCVGGAHPCIDDRTDAWLWHVDPLVPLRLTRVPAWLPYVSPGIGVIHAAVHDAGPYDSAQTNLATNLGGGAMYWFTDWFAARADVRWFHAFVDERRREGGYFHDYDFGRVSLGVTFAPAPATRP